MILKKKLHQHLIKINEKLISCVTIFWNETEKSWYIYYEHKQVICMLIKAYLNEFLSW